VLANWRDAEEVPLFINEMLEGLAHFNERRPHFYVKNEWPPHLLSVVMIVVDQLHNAPLVTWEFIRKEEQLLQFNLLVDQA
jgi:hypothetical protein